MSSEVVPNLSDIAKLELLYDSFPVHSVVSGLFKCPDVSLWGSFVET